MNAVCTHRPLPSSCLGTFSHVSCHQGMRLPLLLLALSACSPAFSDAELLLIHADASPDSQPPSDAPDAGSLPEPLCCGSPTNGVLACGDVLYPGYRFPGTTGMVDCSSDGGCRFPFFQGDAPEYGEVSACALCPLTPIEGCAFVDEAGAGAGGLNVQHGAPACACPSGTTCVSLDAGGQCQ